MNLLVQTFDRPLSQQQKQEVDIPGLAGGSDIGTLAGIAKLRHQVAVPDNATTTANVVPEGIQLGSVQPDLFRFLPLPGCSRKYTRRWLLGIGQLLERAIDDRIVRRTLESKWEVLVYLL